MGPAGRVRGIGGLVTAHCTARVPVDPDGQPGAAWFVVQNNGVAKGIREWALAAGVGDSGESGTAVCGARYAREVVGVRASGVIEGGANLHGVIRVSRSVCLRLNNVGGRLSAGDQVYVGGAIRQGDWQQFLHQLREGASSGSRTSLCLAAGNHDKASPEALHLVDALLVNRGTVKSRRKALDVDNFVLLLRFCGAGSSCGERAKACQGEKDAGQDDKQPD